MKNIAIPIEEKEINKLEENSTAFKVYTLRANNVEQEKDIYKEKDLDLIKFLNDNNIKNIATIGISDSLHLNLKKNNINVILLNHKEKAEDFIQKLI